MTKQDTFAYAPFLRAGAIFAALFAASFYIGFRLSVMLDGRVFVPADPFAGCSSAAEFAISWARLICPTMLSLLFIFASAFSPFCAVVSAAAVVRSAFTSGLMFALLSPGCAALFAAELFAALSAAVMAVISLAKCPFLRAVSFRRNSPSFRDALRFAAEFLVISGACAFVYMPAAVISHIF